MRIPPIIVRFCLFVLGLIVVLLFLNWFVTFGAKHSSKNWTGKINSVFGHAIDPEFILFGSSVADVGFDAPLFQELTQMSAFNAAIDGTALRQNQALIHEFIGYSEDCEYLAIGISFFSFTNSKGPLTQPTRWYAQIGNENIDTMFRQNVPDLYWKVRWLPGYAFTQYSATFYKDSAYGWLNYLKGQRYTSATLGSMLQDRPYDEAEAISPSQFDTKLIQIDSAFVSQVEQLLQEIRAKGIRVILIRFPMYIDGQRTFKNYSEVSDVIRQELIQPGDIFIDFSDHPLCNDKTYFYNNGHVNRDGAQKVTEEIAKQVQLLSDTSQQRAGANQQ
ncbi:MAG: hypothetical protein AAFX93_18140 [Verrucomicrobiota bacterium]